MGIEWLVIGVIAWLAVSRDRVAQPARAAIGGGVKAGAGAGHQAALSAWDADAPGRDARLKKREAWLAGSKGRRRTLQPLHKVWRGAVSWGSRLDAIGVPALGRGILAAGHAGREAWATARDDHEGRRQVKGNQIDDAKGTIRDFIFEARGRCTWPVRYGRACGAPSEDGHIFCGKHLADARERGLDDFGDREEHDMTKHAWPADAARGPWCQVCDAQATRKHLDSGKHNDRVFEANEKLADGLSLDQGYRACDRCGHGMSETGRAGWGLRCPNCGIDTSLNPDGNPDTDPQLTPLGAPPDWDAIDRERAAIQTTPATSGGTTSTKGDNVLQLQRRTTGTGTTDSNAQLDVIDMEHLLAILTGMAAKVVEVSAQLKAAAETSRGLPDALTFNPGPSIMQPLQAMAEAAPDPDALQAWAESVAAAAEKTRERVAQMAVISETGVEGTTAQVGSTGS